MHLNVSLKGMKIEKCEAKIADVLRILRNWCLRPPFIERSPVTIYVSSENFILSDNNPIRKIKVSAHLKANSCSLCQLYNKNLFKRRKYL